jgi:uncharacterized protein
MFSTDISNYVINGWTDDVIKTINSGKVDINKKYNGKTLLILASNKKSKIDIVNFLLAVDGIDINSQDNYGTTAIMVAAKEGNEPAVKALVNAGADLDLQDEFGDTALIYASRERHKNIVKILVDAGADLNIKNNRGENATTNTSESISQIINNKIKENLKGFNNSWINMREETITSPLQENEYGDTTLIKAAAEGDLNRVNNLIHMGSDINHQNVKGQTALHHASVYGHKKVVNLLLREGANPNIVDDEHNKYDDITGKLT